MKITQTILYKQPYSSYNVDAWSTPNQFFWFDPSLFTGITKIYLECDEEWYSAESDGEIRLYNDTGDEAVPNSVIAIGSASWTRGRSADLSGYLTSPMLLKIQIQRTAGAGFVEACGIKLIIQHESSDASRKSATYLYLIHWYYHYGSTWVKDQIAAFVKPKIDKYDGTVKSYLECWLYSVDSETAEARLWDDTAGAEVAGSLVSTTSPSFVRLVSSELTLDETHVYFIQVRSQAADGHAYLANAYLKITSEGFNKIAAIANVICGVQMYSANGFVDLGGKGYFEPDFIDGEDGLSYELFWIWRAQIGGAWSYNQRLYDKTNTAVIAGTEHLQEGSGNAAGYYDDDPTMPGAAALLAFQHDSDTLLFIHQGFLYAIQREDLPAGPSLPADPTQPTGYHCFMSQFIRNLLANGIPLETPDGINRCW